MALKTPGLAPLAKPFPIECNKGNAIYRTGQCDVIIFFNAIHNNKIRQYLQIAASRSHYLGGPIMLQITVKYFNFLITVMYCKRIELKTFV